MSLNNNQIKWAKWPETWPRDLNISQDKWVELPET